VQCYGIPITVNQVDIHSHGNYDIQWRTQEFFRGGGGGLQITFGTEGRVNGKLGAVAP
jgi:hypothetical protein